MTHNVGTSEKRSEAPRWTPPKWINRATILMLKMPGLQRIVGKSTALLTFTSGTSDEPVTMPISYLRIEDRVLITAHRTRRWWRNLVDYPQVEIRVAGEIRRGIASVVDDPDDAFADFLSLLEAQPAVARMNDVPLDDEGQAERAKTRQVLAHMVVVSIKLES